MVENQGGETSQAVYNQSFRDFQEYQEGFLQNQEYNEGYASGFAFPDPSPIFPWPIPPVHAFNAIDFNINPSRNHGVLHSNSLSSSLYNLRSSGLQFAYDGSSISHLGIAAIYGGTSDAFAHTIRSGSSPFSLQSELGKMTAQEIMDAKALAASKSHSEAERRRRERINTHLAKLRSLLPNTTKTDKASLLAEVIQHVKELKRQTSEIAESSPVPTESDEVTVDDASEQDGKFVIKASLCCEDRSDLLSDIIRTLKSLRLKTLKAEITTLGGRVKNVLVVTGEENGENIEQYSIASVQEALKSVMERTSGDNSSPGSIKRQRTNISILDHSSF